MDVTTNDGVALAERKLFLARFKERPNRRQHGKVIYPLEEILLVCSDIARFGERKLALLRRCRPFVHGTPAHDHLGDIFATLNAEAFRRCFIAWVSALIKAPTDVHRDRRQDLAPLRLREERQGADSYGLGLRGKAAAGLGAGRRRREIQRDRHHPRAARYKGFSRTTIYFFLATIRNVKKLLCAKSGLTAFKNSSKANKRS